MKLHLSSVISRQLFQQISTVLVDSMGSDLSVVNSARVSFGGSSTSLTEKDVKLIKYLGAHEHYSPFESCTATVKITCPIYISKQIMRHRTGAYNEISRRYTSKDIDFYTPAYREQSGNNRQASTDAVHPSADIYLEKTQLLHKEALNLYNRMIEDGVCKEQARGVLPQNLMTEFFMTMNLRNWAHFIKLRRHDGAQKEIALIADAVSCILKVRFPISMEALLT